MFTDGRTAPSHNTSVFFFQNGHIKRHTKDIYLYLTLDKSAENKLMLFYLFSQENKQLA